MEIRLMFKALVSGVLKSAIEACAMGWLPAIKPERALPISNKLKQEKATPAPMSRKLIVIPNMHNNNTFFRPQTSDKSPIKEVPKNMHKG